MARISILLHFWLLSVYLDPIHELPCQGLAYTITGTVYVIFRTCLLTIFHKFAVMDMVARVCAGVILALRTYAIWHQNNRVGVLLLLGTVGQTFIWCLVEPDRKILLLEPLSHDPL